MSTRSGKRIHGTHENALQNITKVKGKKRKNYVRYPSDEERIVSDKNEELSINCTRKSQRNRLKEQNIESVVFNYDTKNSRQTRSAVKIQSSESIENIEPDNEHKKKKKSQRQPKMKATTTEQMRNKRPNKMKKQKSSFKVVDNVIESVADKNPLDISAHSFHSAAGSPVYGVDDSLNISSKMFGNKTCMSSEHLEDNRSKPNRKRRLLSETTDNESFHIFLTNNTSCVKNKSYMDEVNKQKDIEEYSPTINNCSNLKSLQKNKKKKSININLSVIKLDPSDLSENHLDIKCKISGKKNKRAKSASDNFDKSQIILNTTLENIRSGHSNNQYDPSKKVSINRNETGKSNEDKKQKSSIKNISDEIGNTSSVDLDVTYDKRDSNETSDQAEEQHNIISKTHIKRSRLSSNNLLEQGDRFTYLNNTYDKDLKTNKLLNSQPSDIETPVKFDTTFEVEKSFKLDSSLDKSDSKRTSSSSVLSLDTTYNIPLEISKGNSHISIISNDSRTENIASSTPVLIDSSMDESHYYVGSKLLNKSPSKETDTKTSTPPLNHKRNKNMTSLQTEDSLEIRVKTTPNSDVSCSATRNVSPLLPEGTYTEIKVRNTHLNECSSKEVMTLTVTPLKREGTYTEIKNKRIYTNSLNHEGTYTEIKPLITPNKTNDHKLRNCITLNQATKPLSKEATFTKEGSSNNLSLTESPKLQIVIDKTPTRRKSLPSPGCTPFPLSKSTTKEKSHMNITRSIEKSARRSSIADMPRATKVMFCSPVNNPTACTQMKGKIIKSNLKGSNKSFIFDDTVRESVCSSRKRSYTQSEAEDDGKRRLPSQRQRQRQTADRLSRPRTSSASATLQNLSKVSKKLQTDLELVQSRSKAESKGCRTKLPDFAALHQKHFAKMESLDECQQRKTKRARQLITPTAPDLLDKACRTETAQDPISSTQSKKTETPKKYLIPSDNAKGYTRFGFKLNLDMNPFSIPPKAAEVKDRTVRALRRQAALPSLVGATSGRKNIARQTVLREKSVVERRTFMRSENRTVIKGVRTNRRFELQMKMRNVNI